MSAFLGPIHYQVYDKILVLEDLTEEILKTSCKEPSSPALVRGELSQIIDLENIHGSLSAMVEKADQRNIEAISLAIKEGIDRKNLEDLVYDFSLRRFERKNFDSLEEVFRYIMAISLDGMPCNGGLILKANENGQISFQINRQVHASKLEAYGLEEESYYKIKRAFIEGALAHTSLEVKGRDNDFTVSFA